MSDFQAIADRVEIEALRGEFTDAAMMCDYDRVASLFTPDGALRMPNVPVELVGREQRYLDTTPLTGSPPRAE
jgi:ketosteroid isomerase-like protein